MQFSGAKWLIHSSLKSVSMHFLMSLNFMRSNVYKKPLLIFSVVLFAALATIRPVHAVTTYNTTTIEKIRKASPLFSQELSELELRSAFKNPISTQDCNKQNATKANGSIWHRIFTKSNELKFSNCPQDDVMHIRSYSMNAGGQLWVIARESGVSSQTWAYDFYVIDSNQQIFRKTAREIDLEPPLDNTFLSAQDEKFTPEEDMQSPIYLLEDGTFVAQPNPYTDPKWQNKHISRNFLYRWDGAIFKKTEVIPFGY